MALVTVAGSDVLEGRIHMPIRGAWWAEFKLDASTAPTGAATITAALGGITLSGTVIRAGVFLGEVHIKLVGGANGLATIVGPLSYQSGQLGDPLAAIISKAGETLSSTTTSSIKSVSLPAWTMTATHAGQALDELCSAASQILGQSVSWRILPDGTVFVGVEAFPSATLPTGVDILDQFPAGGRVVLSVPTPTLVPGVNLTDVGANVLGVDHWIQPDQVRTWAWTSFAS